MLKTFAVVLLAIATSAGLAQAKGMGHMHKFLVVPWANRQRRHAPAVRQLNTGRCCVTRDNGVTRPRPALHKRRRILWGSRARSRASDRLGDGRPFSYWAAALSQISAISIYFWRSLSELAAFAQPMHSSAYFRNCFADMTRSVRHIQIPIPIIHVR